jgi:hypothetical protein
MAHSVDGPVRRHAATRRDVPTWATLSVAGLGLFVVGAGLTAVGARTSGLPGAVAFVVWFLATITWADIAQRALPWGVAIPLGALLLLVAAFLPSRTIPPYDAASYGAALASALGLGLTFGPLVGRARRLLRRVRDERGSRARQG